MSRNIGQTLCHFCGESVVLEESSRLITREEAKVHYDEYQGMHVANAHCSLCGAKYLAWCAWIPYRRASSAAPFEDLSFRSTFDDEPSHEDMPDYSIRRPAFIERHEWPRCSCGRKTVFPLGMVLAAPLQPCGERHE